MDDVEAAKRRAGRSAARRVDDGDVVGLGTGSTAAYAIRELGRRVEQEIDVVGVPTSYQSRALAHEVGVPVAEMGDRAHVDVAIDGADQVAGSDAVKGGGAAHVAEKIVDTTAEELVFVVDEGKVSDVLDVAVPLAVLPQARTVVQTRLRDLGGEPVLRAAERKEGPVVTDDGALVIDCSFGTISDPASVAQKLAALPGVIEHGLFVGEADELHIGGSEDVTVEPL